MTQFSRLTVRDWRQFADIDLALHPRLTVITGANASGKSTLLGILARHVSWSRPYSSAPLRATERGSAWSNLGPRRARRLLDQGGSWGEVGTLRYGNGVVTAINVPLGATQAVRAAYDLHMPAQQSVEGLYLSSHRSQSEVYTSVPNIPTAFVEPGNFLIDYTSQLRAQWAGEYTGRSSHLALKESLIAAAVFGDAGSTSIDFNEEAYAIWTGFQGILRATLPRSIRFNRLRVRVPDVIVETQTGDFILDEASGGVSAIVEIAWQLFLKARQTPSFCVLMDEPENHLHPSLQRELLPSLLASFPDAQFIVATHSPFVVTSTPDSVVYALDYDPENSVHSRLLDYSDKSATADETLKRVLGVESTYPVWAEHRFDEIVRRHMKGSLSAENLAELRDDLRSNGLESAFPDAAVAFLDGQAHTEDNL